MPDDRRFGIVWMSEKTLAAAYDLTGAFSNVAVKLLPYASEGAVIERLDALLARYGGLGAIGRKDQTSHAFLDAELKQLQAMSRILPPIFLLVAAFLVNMTLARLVALEREQIGLLKAIGYTNTAVGLHYLQFVSIIAIAGAVIGIAVGTWLGIALTRLYSDFFHFPFLVFRLEPSVYLIAVGTTILSAVLGAWRAVQGVVRLAPAVAMSSPAPTQYRQFMAALFRVFGRISQTVTMVIRHLSHGWVRTFSSILGIALAGAILVGSLWSFDSIDFMIDVTFHQSDRQDATISFTQEEPMAALFEVSRLPGVLRAELYRSVAVKLRNGHVERRVAIVGKPPSADLSRVLDQKFTPVRLPETGITVSDMLARILDVEVGDVIEVELLEKDHRIVQVPVTAIIQGYLGLMSYMEVDALNRLVREGSTISGVHLIFDEAERVPLLQKLKSIPAANFIALQRVSLQKFRETLAQNILLMISIYVTLAVIIVFGVIYNFARISLSEQGREIASLRVLGFTRTEASSILLTEIFILVAVAQPFGWFIGSGLAYLMVKGFESELYRVPLVLEPSVFAKASIIVMLAALAAALIVRRRVDRLDLIAVLKTRE
jgi:putative ABC transport system permease protein